MDKNLKLGPRADKNFEKCDLERAESSKNETKKCRTPLSLSLRSDTPGLHLLPPISGCVKLIWEPTFSSFYVHPF